jgi:integrase
MGLVKRGKHWYVEFPVIDDGKILKLAPYGSRSMAGIKMKRWKSGPIKELAEKLEASKRTELETIGISSVKHTALMTFRMLTEAYLTDQKIQRQALYKCKKSWIENRFVPTFGAGTLAAAVTCDTVEAYLEGRRKEVAIATVNRELAGIKHIFSWAVLKGRIDRNPLQHLKQEREDNVRDEILEPAQFDILQQHAPTYLRPINLVAYQTAMRRGEILGLTWDKVDEKKGFIRLSAEDTKTDEGRIVPLSSELKVAFAELRKTRALHEKRVFLREGQSVADFRGAFVTACKRAGIEGFRFHDLRHTAITNMRRAGIDPLTIMRISGHKTMECFTRYNSFREPDLSAAADRLNTHLTLAHRAASKAPATERAKAHASA